MGAFTCYSIAWALVFVCTSAAAKVIAERFGEQELRREMLGKRGRRVALLPGSVALLSTVSLLAWGVTHSKWLVIVSGWAVGLVASGFLQQLLPPDKLIMLAPPVLVLLNTVLWLFFHRN